MSDPDSSPSLARSPSGFVNLGPLSSFNNPTNALVLQVHAKNFNLIKAVCFQREWSVHTAMQELCKRLQISEDVVLERFSIFIPGTSEDSTGKYLEDRMAIFSNCCGSLAPRSIIQLREKPVKVMVVSEEGESSHQRISLRDDTANVLLQLSCNHFHCNAKDFELCIPETNGRPGRVLSLQQTLFDQGIENADRLVITMKRKKRNFMHRSRSGKLSKHGITSSAQRSNSVTVSQPMFVKTTRESEVSPVDDQKDLCIFGQHLTRALFQNGKLVHSVPPLVLKCIEYIETKGETNKTTRFDSIRSLMQCGGKRKAIDKQGIFRISSKMTDLEKARQRFDSTEVEVDLSNITDIHVVTNLLKSYLRSLTEPPIPFDMYHRFLDLAKKLKTDMHLEIKRKQFVELLLLLPEPNAQLLRALIPFLAKVSGRSARNRMPTASIATIFGPILMLSPDAESNPMCVAMDSHAINDVTQFMVENHELISSTIRPPTQYDLDSPFNLFNIRSQLLARIAEKPIPPSPFPQPQTFPADLDQATTTSLLDLFGSHLQSLSSLVLEKENAASSHLAPTLGFVKALYNYRPSTCQELAMRRCDVVRVIDMDESLSGCGWWMGEIDRMTGLFPHSFCSILVDSVDKLPVIDENLSDHEDPFTGSEDFSESDYELFEQDPLETP